MGLAGDHQKQWFKVIVNGVLTNISEIKMKVNSVEVNHTMPDMWPSDWSRLYIMVSKRPIIREELTSSELQEHTVTIAGIMLSLIIPLLPLEENEIEHNLEGLPEGAISRIEVNRYERNILNREACILHHGLKCKVCSFNFESFYGSIGRDFIHVHHVTPVSRLGPNYTINPVTDLVPVCPNCHAMLHKKTPPYTVDELISIIQSNPPVAYSG
ncbi:hypothetical protein D3P08_00510 [Paenibacillus nanensis]|uniref:HNH domain-containing protein n=2 Tax=Paenibacillus nanensis TaxID=393251 RepID=A0A3A1VI25_9BACL|nr:hypothetical protein D3P08_00510 [Paenibacillus nanensis]